MSPSIVLRSSPGWNCRCLQSVYPRTPSGSARTNSGPDTRANRNSPRHSPFFTEAHTPKFVGIRIALGLVQRQPAAWRDPRVPELPSAAGASRTTRPRRRTYGPTDRQPAPDEASRRGTIQTVDVLCQTVMGARPGAPRDLGSWAAFRTRRCAELRGSFKRSAPCRRSCPARSRSRSARSRRVRRVQLGEALGCRHPQPAQAHRRQRLGRGEARRRPAPALAHRDVSPFSTSSSKRS